MLGGILGLALLLLPAWPGLPADQGASVQAGQVFDQMAAAVDQVKDYQAEWHHFSSTGGARPLSARKNSQGKFLRSPALSYEKILTNDNNFKDPLDAKTQMIYDSRTRELKMLLSGSRRLLGVVHVFGEDSQCLWLNGETLQHESLWEQVADWRAKRESGTLALRTESYQGRDFFVLSLGFPAESLGARPEITRIEIWVDAGRHLPLRYRGFVAGEAQPVLDHELTKLETNVGIKPEGIAFEGLSLWSFPAQFVAPATGLENLRFQPLPVAAEAKPPSFDQVQEHFAEALAPVKDYRAELRLGERYFRVKTRGKIAAQVIKAPFFFRFDFEPDFRINHLHLASPGGKVCYRRNEHSYATLGGGAMRLVGVQLTDVDYRRFDFTFGEGLDSLNLFALLERMKWYSAHGQVSTEMVQLGGKACPRAVMTRSGQPRVGEIQNLAVVFNPETWLPLRLEYSGSQDPEGFGLIEYQSILTNLGLKEDELRF